MNIKFLSFLLFALIYVNLTKGEPFVSSAFSDDPPLIRQIKNWWNNTTETKKNEFYKNAQDITSKIYTPDYLWNSVNPTYQRLKGEVKKDLGWVAATLAAGGAAVGLYRWVNRRGLGGIVKDFLEIDKKTAYLHQQISQKISELNSKDSKLSFADKALANTLLSIIKNNRITSESNTQKLKQEYDTLESILKSQKKTSEQTNIQKPIPYLPQ